MEKILSDAKKYLKVTFNPKGKANKEIVSPVSDSFSFCKKIKDQNSLMFMASFEI